MVTDTDTTGTEDQDSNSQNPDNTGAPNGAASESDIMALKRAHEAELSEINTKLSTSTQEVTTERAAREAAEVKLTESSGQLDTAQKENADLRVVNDASAKSLAELKASNLTDRRNFLVKSHGLKEDQVKDMDESQLLALEAVLPTVKQIPSPANFDMGSNGGSGVVADMTAREKIAAGLKGSS